MARKAFVLSVLVIFAISLTGCAAGRKQNDLEMQNLKNQVSALESQLASKDEEINSLRNELSRGQESNVSEMPTVSSKKRGKQRVVGEVKSRPSIRHIQVALKNAGFEPGPVDGKMGRATRGAIKAFQNAHNLSPDGKVGKDTWDLLKEYLYKKVK